MKKMKGFKIVKIGIVSWSFLLLIIFGKGTFFVGKIFKISYWNRNLENNEIIFLGLLILSFVYLLNKVINKISDCYSDYLDYCDIEDIKNNGAINETTEADKNINNEIWNNINRRAEKAKVVSLSSLKFREIKEEFADFLKRQSK